VPKGYLICIEPHVSWHTVFVVEAVGVDDKRRNMKRLMRKGRGGGSAIFDLPVFSFGVSCFTFLFLRFKVGG
jgi:hypothetical protein